MAIQRWTRPQLKLAFNLYCQLPFGKLDQRNQDVIVLASLIDRTPSAVAMKLVNFASLDPAITGTGRAGLAAIVERRIKQQFFRNALLSSYRSRCCMSGLSEPSLLVASHIVPWEHDKGNRLNPRNGLCLSALHDRAFDRGLIALSDALKIMVSPVLKRRADEFAERVLLPMEGQPIEVPERFTPRHHSTCASFDLMGPCGFDRGGVIGRRVVETREQFCGHVGALLNRQRQGFAKQVGCFGRLCAILTPAGG